MTMNSRTRSKFASAVLASAIGLAALAGFASPAQAALTAGTTATFTLTSSGALSITAPESKDLGSVAHDASTTTAAQLGAVAVADTRASNLGSWTAKVSSTDFTTGSGDSLRTIAKANAFYWSGLATTTGTAVFTAGQALETAKLALSEQRTAYSATAIVGNNTASWNPTMSVSIPAGSVVGTYTATITHSVA